MILYPAIDLKDGQCVRLVQGDMDRTTIFNDNPLEQALAFKEKGFEWIHIVDLNGAFKGAPVNAECIENIKCIACLECIASEERIECIDCTECIECIECVEYRL